MIVQACLNGARARNYHPALPVTPEMLARDAIACIMVGAAEIHMHPRRVDGRESLADDVISPAVLAVRRACPGTLIGLSTGAWIEGSLSATTACIAGWRYKPDYASVNLSEDGAETVIRLLMDRGIGVEAGVSRQEDLDRLIALECADCVLRILVEIEDQDEAAARRQATALLDRICRLPRAKPILLHGQDATMWPLLAYAAANALSFRVGLEDGMYLRDGCLAANNAELVADAVSLLNEIRHPRHD
ncbi:3-keto-5-aminohexanoate cleavage protein [Nguyenibacter vanlangensis]|uniref:3-keto-5-aminohexanoate cleavage protein n=1 Tax=Nguyenibacter vanlangensis TaxID=1216886 RepID=A0ABZ3D0R8_9PROT